MELNFNLWVLKIKKNLLITNEWKSEKKNESDNFSAWI